MNAYRLESFGDLRDDAYWLGGASRALGRFFLLASLHGQPQHGYALKQAIQECCAGQCCPTDAMIYPALKQLVAEGYIECVEEPGGRRPRKVCRLTEKGQAAYAAGARAWGQLLPGVQTAIANAPGRKVVRRRKRLIR